jgi:hypothetical protein
MKHLPLLFACLLPFGACTKKTDVLVPGPANPAPVDHGHGTAHDLGSMTIGAHTFQLVQEGAVEPGNETALTLTFAKDKPLPGTVRAWIGVESGEGSKKEKVGKDSDAPNGLHGHVDAPKPIPAGSKIWIEIEENGKTERQSVAWK